MDRNDTIAGIFIVLFMSGSFAVIETKDNLTSRDYASILSDQAHTAIDHFLLVNQTGKVEFLQRGSQNGPQWSRWGFLQDTSIKTYVATNLAATCFYDVYNGTKKASLTGQPVQWKFGNIPNASIEITQQKQGSWGNLSIQTEFYDDTKKQTVTWTPTRAGERHTIKWTCKDIAELDRSEDVVKDYIVTKERTLISWQDAKDKVSKARLTDYVSSPDKLVVTMKSAKGTQVIDPVTVVLENDVITWNTTKTTYLGTERTWDVIAEKVQLSGPDTITKASWHVLSNGIEETLTLSNTLIVYEDIIESYCAQYKAGADTTRVECAQTSAYILPNGSIQPYCAQNVTVTKPGSPVCTRTSTRKTGSRIVANQTLTGMAGILVVSNAIAGINGKAHVTWLPSDAREYALRWKVTGLPVTPGEDLKARGHTTKTFNDVTVDWSGVRNNISTAMTNTGEIVINLIPKTGIQSYDPALTGTGFRSGNMRCYNLSENVGSPYFDESNNENGTTPVNLSSAGGKRGRQINLTANDANNRFTYAAGALGIGSNQSFTMNMWFKGSTTAGNDPGLFMFGISNGVFLGISTNTTGSIQIWGADNTSGGCGMNNRTTFPADVIDGSGTHKMLTFVANHTGLNLTVYVNGTIAGVIAGWDARKITACAGTQNYIGKLLGFDTIIGEYDEPAMWNRSLSPSEVSDLYNDSVGNFCPFINATVVIPDPGCATINVSTDFTNNISSNGNCITINNNNTVLNCTGNTIRYGMNGSASVSGVLIGPGAVSNVTVRNCIILKNSTVGAASVGINFSYVNYSTIVNNNVTSGGGLSMSGIYLFHASHNVIENNSVNSTSGTATLGMLGLIGNSRNNNASYNTFNDTGSASNTHGAVQLRFLTGGASNNTIFSNTLDVRASSTSANVFGYQDVIGNDDNRIINNTFLGLHSGTGVPFGGIGFTSTTTGMVIENNTISVSRTSGPNVFGIDSNVALNITKNRIYVVGIGNNSGIRITAGTGYVVSHNTIFVNGTVPNNFGVWVQGTGVGNSFVNNSLNATGLLEQNNAVQVENNGSRFVGNVLKASGNNSYAISIVGAGNKSQFWNTTLIGYAGEWMNVSASINNTNNFTNTTFLEYNGSINIRGLARVNDTILVTKTKLNITFNLSFLNSTNLSVFNQSAQIRLFNLTFDNPQVTADYAETSTLIICDATLCIEESYTSSTFTFNVTQFTSHSSEETPLVFNVTNINITKIDSPDPVLMSTFLNYTIFVNITGNGTAFNVTVNDTYPNLTIFLTSSPTVLTGTNNTWVLGNLTAGTNFSINVSLLVNNVTNNLTINNSVNVTFQNETSQVFQSRRIQESTQVVLESVITINTSFDGQADNASYELGSKINITVNASTLWCLDVANLKNYTCNTSQNIMYELDIGRAWQYEFQNGTGYNNTFRDITNTTNVSFYLDGRWDIWNFTMAIRGSQRNDNYPQDIHIDVRNNGTKDLILPGYLHDNVLYDNRSIFSGTYQEEQNLTFTAGGSNTLSFNLSTTRLPEWFRNVSANTTELNLTFQLTGIPLNPANATFEANETFLNRTGVNDTINVTDGWGVWDDMMNNWTNNTRLIPTSHKINEGGSDGISASMRDQTTAAAAYYRFFSRVQCPGLDSETQVGELAISPSRADFRYVWNFSIDYRPLEAFTGSAGGTIQFIITDGATEVVLFSVSENIPNVRRTLRFERTQNATAAGRGQINRFNNTELDAIILLETGGTPLVQSKNWSFKFKILNTCLSVGADDEITLDIYQINLSGVQLVMNNSGLFNNSRGQYTSESFRILTADVNSVVLNVSDSIPEDTSIEYFVSANNGTNFERVTPGQLYIFTNPGNVTRWRAILNTTNTNETPNIFKVGITAIGNFSENISIDVGNDGVSEFNYSGFVMNTTQVNISAARTGQRLIEYAFANCNRTTGDLTCIVPVRITSASAGRIRANNFNLTSRINPVILPAHSINKSNNLTNMSIRWTNGHLNLSNLTIEYWGWMNVPLLFHSVLGITNYTERAYLRYSYVNFSMPQGVDGLFFPFANNNSKNVTPFGQKNATPIFNFSNDNRHDGNITIWGLWVNQSLASCITIEVSNETLHTTQKRVLFTVSTTRTVVLCANITNGTQCRGWLRSNLTNCNATAATIFGDRFRINPICGHCVPKAEGWT